MAKTAIFSHLAYIAIILFSSLGAFADKAQSINTRSDADQSEILNCVKSVLSDEKVGFMSITGGAGFSLLKGNDTVVAGGRIGKGRVIGAGHADFLKQEEDSDKNSDRKAFLTNMFWWVSNGKPASAALLSNGANTAEILEGLKLYFGQVDIINEGGIASTKANVIVAAGHLENKDVSKLQDRVEKGMGLVMTTTNWHYKANDGNDEKFAANWAPNQIASKAGFTFRHDKAETKQQYAGNGGEDNSLWSALLDKYRCKKEEITTKAPVTAKSSLNEKPKPNKGGALDVVVD